MWLQGARRLDVGDHGIGEKRDGEGHDREGLAEAHTVGQDRPAAHSIVSLGSSQRPHRIREQKFHGVQL